MKFKPRFQDLPRERLEEMAEAGARIEESYRLLRKADTWQLREAATAVAAVAVREELEPPLRRLAEQNVRSLPRSLRRQLEVALAVGDEPSSRRRRLARLLAGSSTDLATLRPVTVNAA